MKLEKNYININIAKFKLKINATTGGKYFNEYHAKRGGEELCVSKTPIKPGNRVLVIDGRPLRQENLLPLKHLIYLTRFS